MRSTSVLGIRGKNFRVRLEYNDEYVIAHFPEITKFTKDTFLEMKYLLEDWTEFFKTMGYQGTSAAIDKDNVKMRRLLSGLGFKYQGEAEGLLVYIFRGED